MLPYDESTILFSSSSSMSSKSIDDSEASLRDKLSQWCLEFNITHNALNQLLAILQPFTLPRTTKHYQMMHERFCKLRSKLQSKIVALWVEKNLTRALDDCDLQFVADGVA